MREKMGTKFRRDKLSSGSVNLNEIKNSFRTFVSRSKEFAMRDEKLAKVMKEFYIPDYIVVPEESNSSSGSGTSDDEDDAPSCPVIVFINSKSGGQLGSQLLITYRSLLNQNQVIDLGEKKPDKVLHQVYARLHKLKCNGDQFAAAIEKRLRIIVAGGDGTAGWLLGVVSDLKLPQPPPIATVPLGTGNNLPFAFGWGKKNPGTDRLSVEAFLEQVRTAKEVKIDSWHIIMRMRIPKEGSFDPIAPLELPHSLHAFHRVSHSDSLNKDGYHTFRGGFWNYFSMGMDAQISSAFHSERKLHPEKFKNQLANQSNDICKEQMLAVLMITSTMGAFLSFLFIGRVVGSGFVVVIETGELCRTYLKLGCTQGWFLASVFHPSSRNIAQLARVKIMKVGQSQWVNLDIPRSVRSIVCLNLPSFSGGLNPWGNPSHKKLLDRDLTPPYVDDGFFEVVGFRNAWHGLALLAPNGHGTRLAQAHRIRFEFCKGAADHTFMRIDGEPWKQPLHVDDDKVVVEISHRGQVTMLATPSCRSRSVRDPSTCYQEEGSDSDEEDESSAEDWEERRKFGAAGTFKIPDGFDFAQLS
ncbi:hypothetical protein DKX38_025839 [Salix brachista]|uniref:Diacylglycerol kinase n=2 Tax=Magnoliopsida TaxID=3398 RepID=A0A5N5JVD3_9ROSI|nr:hypothetical protein DKX38_025839 [Salix brachista]